MYPYTTNELYCMYDGPVPAEAMQAARRLEALPREQRIEILARYELDRLMAGHAYEHRECVRLATRKEGETPEQTARRREMLDDRRKRRTYAWQVMEAGKKALADAVAAREAAGLPRADWDQATGAPVVRDAGSAAA